MRRAASGMLAADGIPYTGWETGVRSVAEDSMLRAGVSGLGLLDRVGQRWRTERQSTMTMRRKRQVRTTD